MGDVVSFPPRRRGTEPPAAVGPVQRSEAGNLCLGQKAMLAEALGGLQAVAAANGAVLDQQYTELLARMDEASVRLERGEPLPAGEMKFLSLLITRATQALRGFCE